MPFDRKECRIGNVYLIDTMQFDMETITSVYCYSDGTRSLLMDIGTSDNIDVVFQSLIRHGIAIESLIGVVPSHYHFDHGGGCAELYKRMKDINNDFKIYANRITKENLQNSSGHVHGARTTFGKFVGTMEPLPDEAFSIVEFDDFLPVEFSRGERVKLLHTPGHTPDHCSPSVVLNGRTIFTFAGEALGTIYTNSKILTTPTSMPPNFRYDDYVASMLKLREMKPELIGFCHFGNLRLALTYGVMVDLGFRKPKYESKTSAYGFKELEDFS